MEPVDEVMAGAIDLHVHDQMAEGYRWNLVELGNKAIQAKMGGIALKNWYGESASIAYLINHLLGKEVFFGTLVLNRWVGGLNAIAVKDYVSVGVGIKMVYMPTRHSLHQQKWIKGGNANIAVRLFDNNEATPELKEVLSVIAENNLILSTGHISPEESLLLIDEAQKAGVRKILVTHASALPVSATLAQQKAMYAKGAYIEQSVAACLPHYNVIMKARYGVDVKQNMTYETIENILALGIERSVLSTDFGQDANPDCVDGMRMFIKALLSYGLSVDQVKALVQDNPKKLLG